MSVLSLILSIILSLVIINSSQLGKDGNRIAVSLCHLLLELDLPVFFFVSLKILFCLRSKPSYLHLVKG